MYSVLDGIANIIAEVPLAETLGSAADIRSMSQGQGTFTMELACYRKVPASVRKNRLIPRTSAPR